MAKKPRSTAQTKDFWAKHTIETSYTQIPNALLYSLIRNSDNTTPLFMLICRMTFGYPQPNSDKTYTLCWKWPGYKDIAEKLGIKPDKANITRLKEQLINRKMIIQWGKVKGKIYVGPNFALTKVPYGAITFLTEKYKEYHPSLVHKEWPEFVAEFADSNGINVDDFKNYVENFYAKTATLERIAIENIDDFYFDVVNWKLCPKDEL